MTQQPQKPSDPVRPGAPPPATPVPPLPPITTVPRKPLESEYKDGFREIIETIVFVVVLVLLLKTFLAEAFVIPTGSMATTLLGYHKNLTCEKCGYPFRVNASDEAEARPDRPLDRVIGGTCPNCHAVNYIGE